MTHRWVLERDRDPDDPTEREVHLCIRCGLLRDSEWGTLPTYRRQLPRGDSARPQHELHSEEPPCG